MLFNSFVFLAFFVVVYSLYRILPHRRQNILLLLASYLFYGWWDWRFLLLLLLSTLVDYFCSLRIVDAKTASQRKLFLIISVGFSVLLLGFFKYFNFFVTSFQALLGHFGLAISAPILHIVLPVGISFYTFQSIGYVVDVYRGQTKPPQRLLDYALFVSFFPQLVAGPIERASHMLPQYLNPRQVTSQQWREGLFLIAYGLFLKIFTADNLAEIANRLFNNFNTLSSVEVLIASYAFAFQIYCDFAGYSSMARGLAKLMGIELMVNFNVPYFSKDPSEFWQRWHISLSQWLRDYLYIPLGGNRLGKWLTLRNLMLTMLIAGLWHGALWTFVLWGAFHGVLLIIYRLVEHQKTSSGRGDILKVFFFFHLVCLGWIIFRSQSMAQLGGMLSGLTRWASPDTGMLKDILSLMLFIGPIVIFDILQYKHKDTFFVFRWHWVVQGLIGFVFLFLLLTFAAGGAHEFIYFQF